MTEKEFPFLLNLKESRLLVMLNQTYDMTFEEAKEYLCGSLLYKTLADENSKVWYFSDTQLFDLLREEKETGEITSW